MSKSSTGVMTPPPRRQEEQRPEDADGSAGIEPDTPDAMGDLTLLLERWSRGDERARDVLAQRVDSELRRLAASHLALERSGHTLQPTALVNEAYVRLLKQKDLHFESRGRFFAFASELMRRILVDRARAHKTQKRGEGNKPLPIHEVLDFAPEKTQEILELDDALHDLQRFDPEGAKVVEMRYFMGLTHQEIADALGITRIKARRRWEEARAWLYLQMRPERAP